MAVATEAPARRPRRKLTGYWLILPGAIWLGLFFVVPFYTLIGTSLYDPTGSPLTGYDVTWHVQNFADAISDYWRPLVRSLWYAGTATLICLVLGYVLAYAIAFKSGRWKNLMLVLVIAPFFTSFLLRTLSWKLILADDGYIVDIASVPAHPRRGRSSAGDLRGGHRRADVQLPALHGAAALREPGEDGSTLDRGVR